MMAGSSDFSVASERDKSRYKEENLDQILCVQFSNELYREEQGSRYNRFDGANGECEELEKPSLVRKLQVLWIKE